MKPSEELFFQLALLQLEGVGPVMARQLIAHFGSAKEAFDARAKDWLAVPGMGQKSVQKARPNSELLLRIEREFKQMERYNIEAVVYGEDDYPKFLSSCYDAPQILFVRGQKWQNHNRAVSIVGTRYPNTYSLSETALLVDMLAPLQCTIVSGLARGIDTKAHQQALANNLPTIAVLAHGLDRVYPYENSFLADQIEQNGCVMTERLTGTKPDRENFPSRNRIVAGLSAATFVMQTGIRGGSMITANLAFDYNRDVFALCSQRSDLSFSGCHYLVQRQKATIYVDIESFTSTMGWQQKPELPRQAQKSLLLEVDERYTPVLEQLQWGAMSVDQLVQNLKWKSSFLNALLLEMELEGLVHYLPGNRVSL